MLNTPYTQQFKYKSTDPFEGPDKKVLFICTAGILRSPTAARMYASKYNTRCAGSKDEYALIPVSFALLRWADEIVFMNPENFEDVKNRFDFSVISGEIKILNIPDEFYYMDKELQQAIENQYEKLND